MYEQDAEHPCVNGTRTPVSDPCEHTEHPCVNGTRKMSQHQWLQSHPLWVTISRPLFIILGSAEMSPPVPLIYALAAGALGIVGVLVCLRALPSNWLPLWMQQCLEQQAGM